MPPRAGQRWRFPRAGAVDEAIANSVSPRSCAPPLLVNGCSVVFAKESGASLSWHAAAVEGSLLNSANAFAKPGQIVVDSSRWPSFGCDGNVKLVVARLKPLGGRGGAMEGFTAAPC